MEIKGMKKMYLVVSHYSNDDISEFDRVGLHAIYESFELAKADADKRFKEDKENGIQRDNVLAMENDDNDEFEDAVYTVGEESEDNYNCFHNFYAVVPVPVG